MSSTAPTVDPAEIARFERLASTWWDPRGKMAVLHKFNPVRLAYIRDTACRRFERNPKQLDCLKGLRILDIGCGGGILCEPLARLGANVLGADAAEKNIAAAKLHAEQSELAIDYRATTAEALAAAGERFDIGSRWKWSSMGDVKLFVARCAEMVNPGGLMIAAHLTRTLKSSHWRSSAPNTCCAGCRRARTVGTSSSRPTNGNRMERAGIRAPTSAASSQSHCADRW